MVSIVAAAAYVRTRDVSPQFPANRLQFARVGKIYGLGMKEKQVWLLMLVSPIVNLAEF